tara:strand:+ start:90 stop:821 length:732 start_codon:yes stop_codon:yes gene_type:complete
MKFFLKSSKFIIIFIFFSSFLISQENTVDYIKIQDEINKKPLKKPKRRTTNETTMLLERIKDKVIPIAVSICEEENTKLGCKWDIERVIDSRFNAFAYKEDNDNKIVIYSGLFNGLTYEDEIAFVLTHEIGHHIADHINKKISRASIGTLLGIAAGSYIGVDPLTGAQLGSTFMLGDYSKNAEFEADRIAVEILKQAGYSKDKIEMLFYRMSRKSMGSIYSQYGDSHPSHVERISRIRDEWKN